MAERIKKTYTVGGATFATYAEAIEHRKTAIPEKLRKEVCNVIKANLRWVGVRGLNPPDVYVDLVVSALFSLYDIKPKRVGK
jgi:hypothetical protein